MGKPKSDKAPRVTENDDYIAFVQRVVRGLEKRAIEDPAILAHVLMVAQQLSEIANVVVATSAARYKLDPYASPSMGECAAVLGITKQSASDRRKIGDKILAERLVASQQENYSRARAEFAARQRAAAYAAQKMPEWARRLHEQISAS
jgi:type IV secretory pathway TrbL component